MTLLAINIREFRKRKKITQDQLAHYCKVSGAAVSQWESKKNPTTPELLNVMAMTQLFGTTVEHLVHSKDLDIGPEAEQRLSNRLLIRVFAALDQTKEVAMDFTEGTLTRKANLFNALYVLYAGRAIDDSLSDIELMQYVGLEDINPKDKK